MRNSHRCAWTIRMLYTEKPETTFSLNNRDWQKNYVYPDNETQCSQLLKRLYKGVFINKMSRIHSKKKKKIDSNKHTQKYMQQNVNKDDLYSCFIIFFLFILTLFCFSELSHVSIIGKNYLCNLKKIINNRKRKKIWSQICSKEFGELGKHIRKS